MPKFGGPGRKKQCCELRKCLVADADADVNLSKGHVCANKNLLMHVEHTHIGSRSNLSILAISLSLSEGLFSIQTSK